MLAGAATATCNTYDGSCPHGLRGPPDADGLAQPWLIKCSGSCTATSCCRAETGEPLPESRSGVTKDVLLYKTRVTGLSYAKAILKQTEMDAQFKPVFALAGGVLVSQVQMVYAEGSLLVTAEIEANEGETLDQGVTTLPSSADVLAALNKVPSIAEAIIPGQSLAAAEPIGVRYAPGATSAAEAITPPPPPTPPTPPPPAPTPSQEDDDGEEEKEEENTTRTSSAHSSLVGWQVLPFCISSTIFILVH